MPDENQENWCYWSLNAERTHYETECRRKYEHIENILSENGFFTARSAVGKYRIFRINRRKNAIIM